MTWNPSRGSFTPGGAASVALPGQVAGDGGSRGVTVQDLINLGLIDPGVLNGGGTLFRQSVLKMSNAVSLALSEQAAAIQMNSANLLMKMNGLAGVVIGSAGIAAYDSTGAATITIDPATGSVTLSGTITATAGTIGGFTLGATTLSAVSGGNTTTLSSGATAFSAGPTGSPTASITQAGAATFANISVTGGTITTTGYIQATGSFALGGFSGAITAQSTTANTHGIGGVASGSGTVSAGVLGTAGTATNFGVIAENTNASGFALDTRGRSQYSDLMRVSQKSDGASMLYLSRFTDAGTPSGTFLNFRNAADNVSLFSVNMLGIAVCQSLDTTQYANNTTALKIKRFTDTVPTGYLLEAKNAADNTTYCSIDVTGVISIGNTANAVSPTAPNRTITMVVGGTTLYLHAKTTND